MSSLPTTQEEQIIKMAESGRVNRNWLEMVAYNTGVDCDHIKGVDDDFCDRTHKSEIINNQ